MSIYLAVLTYLTYFLTYAFFMAFPLALLAEPRASQGVSQSVSQKSEMQWVKVISLAPVHEAADENSRVMGRLRPGAQVQVVGEDAEFVRIRIERQGREIFGFILAENLEVKLTQEEEFDFEVFSQPEDKKSARSSRKSAPIYERIAVGVSFISSFKSQGSREIQTSPDTNYQVSNLSGGSMFFRAFVDMPLMTSWLGRVAISNRKISLSGDSELTNSVLGKAPLELDQSFLGGEFTLKRYYGSEFWFGSGMELAQGVDFELKISNSQVVTGDDSEEAFIAAFYIAAGYDLPLASSGIFINFEGRAGFIINTDPIMTLVDGILGVSYAF